MISTSQDARSFNPEPHHTSGLPQYHHPPRLTPIHNALTSGSTTYSATPPSTLMCFASRKQLKTIHRSLLHLTDLSLLLSEPTAGSALYLMVSDLTPTMDLFLAVCHHPSAPKHMDSSLTSDSYTALANTLTPPYPRKLSSTLTPPEMADFFPNATMDPDWDVLQQIITSRRLFPSLPVLRFVKGHQGANCPCVTLSLPAQLNIDTDHLAGSYAPCPNKNPTIVPMIAGTAPCPSISQPEPPPPNIGVHSTRLPARTPFNIIFKTKTNGLTLNLPQSTGSHMATQYAASTTKNSLSSNLSMTGSP